MHQKNNFKRSIHIFLVSVTTEGSTAELSETTNTQSSAATLTPVKQEPETTSKPSLSTIGSLKDAPQIPKTEKIIETIVEPSSLEIFQEALEKLKNLGDRGKKYLNKLLEEVDNRDPATQKLVQNVINEAVEKVQRRRKRELILSSYMGAELSKDDEDEDAAVEEVLNQILLIFILYFYAHIPTIKIFWLGNTIVCYRSKIINFYRAHFSYIIFS